MPSHQASLPTYDRLLRLKQILQDETTPALLEKLAAALLGNMLGVGVAVAKSGFQHGGDAGTSGREGRRLRIEAKRYADGTQLSTRELVGEIDDALARDAAIETWILVATREVAEQLDQSLVQKGEAVGVPVLIIDWKAAGFPALAALCTSSPEIVWSLAGAEAAGISNSLIAEASSAREALTRELEAWQLGFASLRAASHLQLERVWTSPRTSVGLFGQDAAGGHYETTIRRVESFAALDAWWSGDATTDAPAAILGFEGVGKTWATLDWIVETRPELPIVLVIPSVAAAGFGQVTPASLKRFIAERLYDLTEVRDPTHWHRRLDRLLQRPFQEGPALVLFLDGMNQEPTAPWLEMLRCLQTEAFAGRIRVIATTRNLHFAERLGSLRGLVVPPVKIEVGLYDDTPGGELDQRLAKENLTRDALHPDLIRFAQIPRLFTLVVRYRERLVEAGQVTVHRLLWEYGRDTLGERAGKSFSEGDWRDWLQTVASHHLAGVRTYNLRDLGETTSRPDLSESEVFRRLSDIIDARFAVPAASGGLQLAPTLVAHALGAALLSHLENANPTDRDAADQELVTWLDPIAGLDEKPEILRAAVSILIERGDGSAISTSVLVTAWLQSQNLPDSHRDEIRRLAGSLVEPLLDTIERSSGGRNRSALTWAVNSLRGLRSDDAVGRAAIIARTVIWVRVVSRDVDPPRKHPADMQQGMEEAERARTKRLRERVGIDHDGPHTVLGVPLEFVERLYDGPQLAVASLLEGYPLVPALAVFEAAAVAESVKGHDSMWDSLKWVCLLNEIDFEATAGELRNLSNEMATRAPEAGVHPDLPARAAALLLWLSCDEANESEAVELNPPLDRHYTYEADYLAKPAHSFFRLEWRHAEQALLDTTIALRRRVQMTIPMLLDPAFSVPPEFVAEVRREAGEIDVSRLETSLYHSGEDHTFEELQVALARCAPDLLAKVLRAKLAGIGERIGESRYAASLHLTDQLLLADDTIAAAVRGIRLEGDIPLDDTKPFELSSGSQAFAANQLLILEIWRSNPDDQIAAILEADLSSIFSDICRVIGPISPQAVEAAVEKYCAAMGKPAENLLRVLSVQSVSLGERAWAWVEELAFDPAFKHRSTAFRILSVSDSLRFGRALLEREWRWDPMQDDWYNHFGSLAFMVATRGLPFEQVVPSLAPWMLLRAAIDRGATKSDVEVACEGMGSVVRAIEIEVPDLGSTITIDRQRRLEDPFSILVTPHYDDDSPFAGFDTKKREVVRTRAVDTAIERINSARQAGASLYLRDFDPADFEIAVELCPSAISDWLAGMNASSEEFTRRVALAGGLYHALCEALLHRDANTGVELWRRLREIAVTKFAGPGRIDEMTLMLFRVPRSDAVDLLLREQLELSHTNTDAAILDLGVASAISQRAQWFEAMIAAEAGSGNTWQRQRAVRMTGFSVGNELPVLGAWPEGWSDLRTERVRDAARWKQKEACARHWWDRYWDAESDDDAYAAWVLFLRKADRRAYAWMGAQTGEQVVGSARYRRRQHVSINRDRMRRAMETHVDRLDSHFIDRRIVDDVGPWRDGNS